MCNNKFIIAFEGIASCGKTTQCKKLCNYLDNQKIKNRYIKFDENTLDRRLFDKRINALYTNDESYHYFLTLIRAYERSKTSYIEIMRNDSNEIIVFDRYIYTDIVALNYYKINQYMRYFLSSWLPDPDLIFYLKINDVNESLKRIRSSEDFNRWHTSEEKLRDASTCFGREFRKTAHSRLVADKSIDILHKDICGIFDKYYQKNC